MRALNSTGARNPTNTKNIQIVLDNLTMYRSELAEIRKARETTTLEELAGSLGGSANDTMQQYGQHFAGQNRATRDEKLLSAMCDELYELALQMREVSDAAPALEINQKNLSIVLDNLSMYQQEYQRIVEAKGN